MLKYFFLFSFFSLVTNKEMDSLVARVAFMGLDLTDFKDKSVIEAECVVQ